MTSRAAVALASTLVLAIAAAAWFLFSEGGPAAIDEIAHRSQTRTGPAGAFPVPEPAPFTRPAPIQPRRFEEVPEDRGPELEVVPGSGILVRVVDAEGRPVPGAMVMPFKAREEQFIESWMAEPAHTGPAGTTLVSLGAGPSHVVVLAKGHVPGLAAIPAATEMRVVLPGEVTLRGRVTVDGAAPGRPLTLVARGFDDPSDAWPEPARNRIRRFAFGEMRLPFDTAPDGGFAVRGIARGSWVTVEIPEGYLTGGIGVAERELSVACTGEPIEIGLRAKHALTGRIVGSSDALIWDPSKRLEVAYALDVPGRSPAIEGSLLVAFGERFAIHHVQPALSGARLVVRTPEGWRLGNKEIRRQITGSFDVGDVAIGDPPLVAFRFEDPSGNAIAGGRVLADGRVSPPSDATGTTTVGVFADAADVIAGAPRFKSRRVPLPAVRTDPVVVRLDRAATLVVRVRHEDPSASVDGLRVALMFQNDEVSRAADSNVEFADVRVTRASGGGGSGSSQTNHYEVERGRDVVVSGFSRGDRIVAAVQDRFATTLLEQTLDLAEDDVTPIELVLRSVPWTLRGTVVDEDGDPIAGAHVGAVHMYWLTRSETPATGAFEIPRIWGHEILVSLSAPGRVPRVVGISNFDEPVIIRLDRARHLAVDLTGPSRGPFDGQVVFEAETGEHQNATPRGERLFWFEALPRRPGTLRATSSTGQTTSVQVGAEETRVTLPRP